MPSCYHCNHLFLTVSIIISGDIMSVDYLCSYCKEADSPYECIMAESSPHYVYYVCLGWDYDIKKFSNTEFEKVQ